MSTPLLEIRDLSVSVAGRPVLKDIFLALDSGELHILMGPNGSGKTTLLKAIMGLPECRVTGGTISFRGRDITTWTPDMRAGLGLGLAFQRPPPVRGVTLEGLALRIGGATAGRRIDSGAATAGAAALLPRELNVGLSGGEIKRSELFQLLVMEPEVALFDEPESGVDLDSIAVVGGAIRAILDKRRHGNRSSGLVVTHTGHIMKHLEVERGHVLIDGSIICRGDARTLFDDVSRHGYEGCRTCRRCLQG